MLGGCTGKVWRLLLKKCLFDVFGLAIVGIYIGIDWQIDWVASNWGLKEVGLVECGAG